MRRAVLLLVVLAATVTLCALLFAPPAPGPSSRSLRDLFPVRKEAVGFEAFRGSPRLPPRSSGALKPTKADAPRSQGGTITRLLHRAGARQGEVVLQLRSAASFEAARESAKKHGVAILDEDGQLLALRLGFADAAQIEALLNEIDPSDYAADANYVVFAPPDPSPATPKNPGQNIVPFEDGARAWLGIEGDNSDWGKGVKIAILDSGVVNDGVFAPSQVQRIPLNGGRVVCRRLGPRYGCRLAGGRERSGGLGRRTGGGSAQLRDNRRQRAERLLHAGASDLRRRRQGCGHHQHQHGLVRGQPLMRDAVDFASAKGVMVVASAGNAGLDRLAYPAAYPGVVSVGAVDALGQHLYYSNASDTLSLAAPGAGVVADWPNAGQVLFSGTSASAPYVSGALAAVMSQNPGMTAADARDLLFAYANEAGRPGPDAEFGNGLLQIGRVMERNQPGIFDVAVASQTFASSAPAFGGAGTEYDVVVQNRGTEPLYDTQLNVTTGGAMQAYSLPLLEPGGHLRLADSDRPDRRPERGLDRRDLERNRAGPGRSQSGR